MNKSSASAFPLEVKTRSQSKNPQEDDTRNQIPLSCPICFSEFTEQVQGLPDGCDHVFCLDCIVKWAKEKNVCPIDKAVFQRISVSHGGTVIAELDLFDIKRRKTPDLYDVSTFCEICNSHKKDKYLLCDACNLAYHMKCLNPPVISVPPGDWYCPSCEPIICGKRDTTQGMSEQKEKKQCNKQKKVHGSKSQNNNPQHHQGSQPTKRPKGRPRKHSEIKTCKGTENVMTNTSYRHSSGRIKFISTIGSYIAVKGSAQQWYPAKVIGSTQSKVKVHFLGWHKRFNAWYKKREAIIRPLTPKELRIIRERTKNFRSKILAALKCPRHGWQLCEKNFYPQPNISLQNKSLPHTSGQMYNIKAMCKLCQNLSSVESSGLNMKEGALEFSKRKRGRPRKNADPMSSASFNLNLNDGVPEVQKRPWDNVNTTKIASNSSEEVPVQESSTNAEESPLEDFQDPMSSASSYLNLNEGVLEFQKRLWDDVNTTKIAFKISEVFTVQESSTNAEESPLEDFQDPMSSASSSLNLNEGVLEFQKRPWDNVNTTKIALNISEVFTVQESSTNAEESPLEDFQGVLLEDLKTAELQYLMKATQDVSRTLEKEMNKGKSECGERDECELLDRLSISESDPSDSKKEEECNEKNSGKVGTPSSDTADKQSDPNTPDTSPSVTLVLRTKPNSNLDEQSLPDSKASQGTQTAIQRQRRPKRRSKGVVYLDSDDVLEDKESLDVEKSRVLPKDKSEDKKNETTIIIQQPQQGQILQTDGQTLIYQPVQMDGSNFVQTPNGIIQIPIVSVAAPSQQVVQMTTTTAAAAGGSPQTITLPSSVQQGNIVMQMVPGSGGLPTMQRIPLPGAELLEEEPLCVNAKQHNRILKRRQARAKLEAEGRIPKERRKYLRKSRHLNAVNRIRDGRRFYSGSSKNELYGKKLSTDSQTNTDSDGLGNNGLVDISGLSGNPMFSDSSDLSLNQGAPELQKRTWDNVNSTKSVSNNSEEVPVQEFAMNAEESLQLEDSQNWKNDETSYEEMLKLKRDLTLTSSLLETIQGKERVKQEHLHLTVEKFKKRCLVGDFRRQLLSEIMKLPGPPVIPVESPVVLMKPDAKVPKHNDHSSVEPSQHNSNAGLPIAQKMQDILPLSIDNTVNDINGFNSTEEVVVRESSRSEAVPILFMEIEDHYSVEPWQHNSNASLPIAQKMQDITPLSIDNTVNDITEFNSTEDVVVRESSRSEAVPILFMEIEDPSSVEPLQHRLNEFLQVAQKMQDRLVLSSNSTVNDINEFNWAEEFAITESSRSDEEPILFKETRDHSSVDPSEHSSNEGLQMNQKMQNKLPLSANSTVNGTDEFNCSEEIVVPESSRNDEIPILFEEIRDRSSVEPSLHNSNEGLLMQKSSPCSSNSAVNDISEFISWEEAVVRESSRSDKKPILFEETQHCLQQAMVASSQRRVASTETIQKIWDAIILIRQHRKMPNVERIANYIRHKHNITSSELQRQLDCAVQDKFLCLEKKVGCKGSKVGIEQEAYRIPDDDVEKDGHDWYCFECHKAGEVLFCSTCHRVYHQACIQDKISEKDKLVCNVCKMLKTKDALKIKKDDLNILLSYTCIRLKEKVSNSRELLNMPRTKAENWRHNRLIYEPVDLSRIEEKTRDNVYCRLEEFQADVETLVHNIVIYYGMLSPVADMVHQMLSECCYDLGEIRQCRDCYRMSNEKWGEYWFCQPCDPPHDLVYAKLKGSPYWPAKVIQVENETYDVRFFGGCHQRAVVQKEYIKPITTSLQQLQTKRTASLARALDELKCYQQLLGQSSIKEDSGSHKAQKVAKKASSSSSRSGSESRFCRESSDEDLSGNEANGQDERPTSSSPKTPRFKDLFSVGQSQSNGNKDVPEFLKRKRGRPRIYPVLSVESSQSKVREGVPEFPKKEGGRPRICPVTRKRSRPRLNFDTIENDRTESDSTEEILDNMSFGNYADNIQSKDAEVCLTLTGLVTSYKGRGIRPMAMSPPDSHTVIIIGEIETGFVAEHYPVQISRSTRLGFLDS